MADDQKTTKQKEAPDGTNSDGELKQEDLESVAGGCFAPIVIGVWPPKTTYPPIRLDPPITDPYI